MCIYCAIYFYYLRHISNPFWRARYDPPMNNYEAGLVIKEIVHAPSFWRGKSLKMGRTTFRIGGIGNHGDRWTGWWTFQTNPAGRDLRNIALSWSCRWGPKLFISAALKEIGFLNEVWVDWLTFPLWIAVVLVGARAIQPFF